MTLLEMQKILGEILVEIQNKDLSPEARALVIEKAQNSAKIAKQMINSADIILRSDKLCARSDRINRVVGE